MSNRSQGSGEIGLLGFLGLVFVTLKLCNVGVVASWPWLWVLSPLWIPLVILFINMGILLLIYIAER